MSLSSRLQSKKLSGAMYELSHLHRLQRMGVAADIVRSGATVRPDLRGDDAGRPDGLAGVQTPAGVVPAAARRGARRGRPGPARRVRPGGCAGRTGATPTTHTSRPLSRSSCVRVPRSHCTKKASSGRAPARSRSCSTAAPRKTARRCPSPPAPSPCAGKVSDTN